MLSTRVESTTKAVSDLAKVEGSGWRLEECRRWSDAALWFTLQFNRLGRSTLTLFKTPDLNTASQSLGCMQLFSGLVRLHGRTPS